MNKPTENDHPAMPFEIDSGTYFGLTKREHAAIALQVPMSNDEEINAMIRRSLLQRFAGQAMQGLMACPDGIGPKEKIARVALDQAKALLAELERSAEK